METFTKIIYKSAITGKFVSKEFAEKNPDTTYAQPVVVKKKRQKEKP